LYGHQKSIGRPGQRWETGYGHFEDSEEASKQQRERKDVLGQKQAKKAALIQQTSNTHTKYSEAFFFITSLFVFCFGKAAELSD